MSQYKCFNNNEVAAMLEKHERNTSCDDNLDDSFLDPDYNQNHDCSDDEDFTAVVNALRVEEDIDNSRCGRQQ